MENGFKYIEFKKDEVILEKETIWNRIVFMLEGERVINYNQFKDRGFQAGSIILLPRTATIKVEARVGSHLLSLSFGIPLNPYDKSMLQPLTGPCDKLNYNFEPAGIRYPFPPSLELVAHRLKQKMDCGHLHGSLQQELFFLLCCFYTKEESTLLFYSTLATELLFKDFIVGNCAKVNNVNEFISLSNMGKYNFRRKFKQVFGIAAKQWLPEQRNQRILNRVTESETTIGELMEEFNFGSQAHFAYYCKRHFDCAPRELIIRYQTMDQQFFA